MFENDPNITGKRLKELREDKGLTMQEEADILNKQYNLQITRGMMSRWESGKAQPSNMFLAAYAKYHNVDLNYIAGLSDVKKPLIEQNMIKSNFVSLIDHELKIFTMYIDLSEKAKLRIDTRIETEYDIMKENEQEKTKDA